MNLPERRPPIWLAMVSAVVLVAAATAAREWPLDSLGGRAIYVTYFPAVVLASLYGGIYPGLLATALSAAVASHWLNPEGKLLVISHPADWLAMAVFLVGCVMISGVCEAMHRARARAARAEAQARLAHEHRRVEEAVREAYNRLNLHVENSPLAVIEWDSDFRITRWAGEAHRVFGWTADEVLRKRIDELPWVYPDDLQSVGQAMADMISGRHPSNVNCNRNVTKNGSVIQCEWYNTSIRDTSGKLISVLSQVLDVTERTRMEERLRKSKDELEERVRERTADLSHAIALLRDEVAQRTSAEQSLRERSDQLRMLAAELTLAEQRERQRLAQVLHDGLQQILVGAKFRLELLTRSQDKETAVEEVAALIDDAIATSRSLTAELSPPILRQGGLVQALEWLTHWILDRHGLTVSLTTHGTFDPVPEEVTLFLFQSARELLFNIAKHAGVREARVQADASDGRVRIAVQDDGAGFDPANLRFSGVDSSGFGLFSIRERLILLGGSMEICSAPGRGCRIELIAPQSITLTRDASTLDSLRQPPSASSVPRESESAEGGRRIRVFLVDDHLVMRQGLAALLRALPDMELVGEASDGGSAVDLVRDIKPEVVIMDISMPGMDGIQATRIIHRELPRVRIIGLSMFGDGDQATAMLQAGAADCLAKSGPSDAIIAAIRSSAGSPASGLAGQNGERPRQEKITLSS